MFLLYYPKLFYLKISFFSFSTRVFILHFFSYFPYHNFSFISFVSKTEISERRSKHFKYNNSQLLFSQDLSLQILFGLNLNSFIVYFSVLPVCPSFFSFCFIFPSFFCALSLPAGTVSKAHISGFAKVFWQNIVFFSFSAWPVPRPTRRTLWAPTCRATSSRTGLWTSCPMRPRVCPCSLSEEWKDLTTSMPASSTDTGKEFYYLQVDQWRGAP